MEIKTCEEYLIRENEQLQQKVDELNKEISTIIIERNERIEIIKTLENELEFLRWKSQNGYAYNNIKSEIKNGKPLILCDSYYLRDVSSLVEKIGYNNVEEQFKKDIEEAKKEVPDEEA